MNLYRVKVVFALEQGLKSHRSRNYAVLATSSDEAIRKARGDAAAYPAAIEAAFCDVEPDGIILGKSYTMTAVDLATLRKHYN